MNSTQISEWIAYNELEPIDSEWRADYRVAYLISMIANMVTYDPKKNSKWIRPEDVMLQWDQDENQVQERQSIEEQKKVMQMFISAFGKQKKKK